MEKQEMITEEVLVSHVVYSKPDNDFKIFKAHFQDGIERSVKGFCAEIHPGNQYFISGSFENPRPGYEKYGKTFVFDSIRMKLPRSLNGIFRYIVKTAKFVGPKVGQKIIDAYKEDTIKVLKEEPKRVSSEIRGITEERAFEISESLLHHEAYEQTIIDLEEILGCVSGISRRIINQLIDKYGTQSSMVVKNNPYILADFSGIGFQTADHVALSIGIKNDALIRKEATILYIMKQNEQNGHIWIEGDSIQKQANNIVSIDGLDYGFRSLVANERIVKDEKYGLYAMKKTYNDEIDIALFVSRTTLINKVDILLELDGERITEADL